MSDDQLHAYLRAEIRTCGGVAGLVASLRDSGCHDEADMLADDLVNGAEWLRGLQ